jgi:hypothetical protein
MVTPSKSPPAFRLPARDIDVPGPVGDARNLVAPEPPSYLFVHWSAPAESYFTVSSQSAALFWLRPVT